MLSVPPWLLYFAILFNAQNYATQSITALVEQKEIDNAKNLGRKRFR